MRIHLLQLGGGMARWHKTKTSLLPCPNIYKQECGSRLISDVHNIATQSFRMQCSSQTVTVTTKLRLTAHTSVCSNTRHIRITCILSLCHFLMYGFHLRVGWPNPATFVLLDRLAKLSPICFVPSRMLLSSSTVLFQFRSFLV
jgi:hypothetical protein